MDYLGEADQRSVGGSIMIHLPDPKDLATALETSNWKGVSIGNKVLIKAAIEWLRYMSESMGTSAQNERFLSADTPYTDPKIPGPVFGESTNCLPVNTLDKPD
jgi:hypothetical protein